MPRKTLILCNPAAGRGRASRVLPRVLEVFERNGRHADSAIPESAEQLRGLAAQAVRDGATELVALGGDGTFHHMAEATFGHQVALGLLPAGGGNDMASGLGLPLDPVRAAQILLESEPREIDALRIRFGDGHTSLCFGSGGLGLDAEAARLARGPFAKWPGAARYIAGALWAYPRFSPVRLEAEMDGKPWSQDVLLAAFMNAPQYGSGFRLAPQARMNDGWMEVALVGRIGWKRILPAIRAMRRTGELRPGELTRIRARQLSCRTDPVVPFQGDGEILGATPLEAEVLPKALRVFAPISSW